MVRTILDDLNAGDAGLEDLDRWAERSSCKPDRIILGPGTAYVRLAGRAERGGPVVLVYAERAWTRATRTPAAPPVADLARHRALRRSAPLRHPSGDVSRMERDAPLSRATAERPAARGRG